MSTDKILDRVNSPIDLKILTMEELAAAGGRDPSADYRGSCQKWRPPGAEFRCGGTDTGSASGL